MQHKRVAFVGMSDVGKSSIISRIVNGIFPTTSRPMFKEVSHLQRNDTVFELHYTSGASNSCDAALRKDTMQLCDIIVYVHAWDNPSSMRWLRSIIAHHPRGVPALLVCNKVDILGPLDETSVGNQDPECDMPHIFVSAKDDIKISSLLQKLLSIHIDKHIEKKECINVCCEIL